MGYLAGYLALELGGTIPVPPPTPVIALDIPGTIGLHDHSPVVLCRFDEVDATTRPTDAAESLADLDVTGGLAMPAVIDGVIGRARQFGSGVVLAAKDRVSGTTLLTRDVSVQVVLTWSAANQEAADCPGTILCRGTSDSAAEYIAYALEIGPVHGGYGELRWLWQDTAGALQSSPGALFAPPTGFTMLSATRRWLSPTEVLCRYYIGGQLVYEVTSAAGAIGGGTTGTMQIGARYTGSWGNWLAGAIDDLLIVDRELAPEEVEATWRRITVYQPLGHRLFVDMHDPGFPLPADPASDAQLDTRMIGHALGYAGAQVERLRTDTVPQRSYGPVLEEWEQALAVTPQPWQDLDTRRERVLSRWRQRRGYSIEGLRDALEGLVGTDLDNLEYLAFDQTIRDDFSTGLEIERWDVQPAGAVTAIGGVAAMQSAGGLAVGGYSDWITMAIAVGGDAREAHLIAKLVFTTPEAGGQAGVWFGDWAHGNYVLLGMTMAGGSLAPASEVFVGNISAGPVFHGSSFATPSALWIHLWQTTTPGTWQAAWSTTSATAGYGAPVTVTTDASLSALNLGGCYFRQVAGVGDAGRVDVDEVILRAPYGDRAFWAYVYRDPGLAGRVDVEGANSVIDAIRHAFTDGALITSKSFYCDDPGSLCDRGPMGAL